MAAAGERGLACRPISAMPAALLDRDGLWGELARRAPEPAEQLRRNVTSPRGTTGGRLSPPDGGGWAGAGP